jgi:hypothetical protein
MIGSAAIRVATPALGRLAARGRSSPLGSGTATVTERRVERRAELVISEEQNGRSRFGRAFGSFERHELGSSRTPRCERWAAEVCVRD